MKLLKSSIFWVDVSISEVLRDVDGRSDFAGVFVEGNAFSPCYPTETMRQVLGTNEIVEVTSEIS